MITPYAAEKHLNFDFNGTPYVNPATWYVGFLREDGSELPFTNNYSRVAVTADATNWPLTSTEEMTNGAELPIEATGDWPEAAQVALYDAPTGGNAWYQDPLEEPFTMLDGQSRSFASGALKIRLV